MTPAVAIPVPFHDTSLGRVRFKLASKGDIDKLSDVFLASDQPLQDGDPGPEIREVTRRFLKFLLSSGLMAVVAELEDRIVGIAFIDILARQKKDSKIKVERPTGIIERVRSTIEHQGVGRMLLANAEGLICHHGLEAAEIGVKLTNLRAKRIYEEAGYRVRLVNYEEQLPDFEGYLIFRYEAPSNILFKELAGARD